MQVQNLHLPPEERLGSVQQFTQLVNREGLKSLYRGLTPELIKVVRIYCLVSCVILGCKHFFHDAKLTSKCIIN